MSTISKQDVFVFHTDLGAMATTVSEVEGYDVEDMMADRAKAQAMSVRFEQIAGDIDINALQAPRTIQSKYLEDARNG